MELFYDGVALHQIGTVRQMGEAAVAVPAEAPDSLDVTTRFVVDATEPGYVQNRMLLSQVVTALNRQQRTLKWSGDGVTWIEQTARVVSHEFPEDPNAWGTFHQQVSVVFQFVRRLDVSHLRGCTFLKSGGAGPAVSLGTVIGFREGYRSTRFAELRSHRKQVAGVLTAEGRLPVSDPALSLAARRAELEAAKEALVTELLNKDGTLVLGSAFNKVVRVEAFDPVIAEDATSMSWSLSAVWTRFPNESNYAVAEYAARVTDVLESGEQELTLAGRIGAPDAATAQAKLALVRTAVLASQGFSAGQKIRGTLEEGHVSQGPPSGGDAATNQDGDAFIEVTFDETYRKRRADVLSYTFTVNESEDVTTNLTATTYSGRVDAGGATASAAYAAALAKAQEIGAGRYQMMKGSTITAEYRKSGTTTTGAEEFVSLSFSYSYQRKGSGRIYLELTTDETSQLGGRNSLGVRGFVAAASEAAARAAYAAKVKSLYPSRLVTGEAVTVTLQKIAKATGPAVETGRGETQDGDGAYVSQVTRLDFAFQLATVKTAGETSMRYEIQVDEDFVAMERVTSVQGEVMAVDLATAQAFLDGYFYFEESTGKYRWGGEAGQVLGKRTQKGAGHGGEIGNRLDGASKVEVFTSLRFNWVFRDALTTDQQVLECELAEEIQFSGTRWVTKPVVDGPSVMQDTGTQEGSRSISGTVKALTETAAKAWVAKQIGLPFPAWGAAAPGTRYVSPPRVGTKFVTLPMTDMIGRAGDYGAAGVKNSGDVNIRAVEMSFSVTEVLPEYGWSG